MIGLMRLIRLMRLMRLIGVELGFRDLKGLEGFPF